MTSKVTTVKTTVTTTTSKVVASTPATTSSSSNLQKYVRPGVTLEDVTKLKECFDIFDYDKGGSVSIVEMKNAISALGLEKDAGKILGLIHTHTDAEEIDFETFLEIFGFSGQQGGEMTLQNIFEEFDREKKGYFTTEEFMNVADMVGERFSANEVQNMIDYADLDHDGVISFDEFKAVVTREYPKI